MYCTLANIKKNKTGTETRCYKECHDINHDIAPAELRKEDSVLVLIKYRILCNPIWRRFKGQRIKSEY